MGGSKEKLPSCFMNPTDLVLKLRRSLSDRGVRARCDGNSFALEFGIPLKNRELYDWETLEDAGLHHGAVVRVWSNPLRLCVTASVDGTARIWNMNTGKCVQTLMAGESSEQPES